MTASFTPLLLEQSAVLPLEPPASLTSRKSSPRALWSEVFSITQSQVTAEAVLLTGAVCLAFLVFVFHDGVHVQVTNVYVRSHKDVPSPPPTA